MPVGHKSCFVGFVFDVAFFSVVVPICVWFLSILFSPFDEVTLCVHVGMMSRRLPHSVSQNHGRRVLKYCNTLNEFDGVVSVLLARIMDRKLQAWSISADVHFDLAKSSKLRRSSPCPFE